MNRNIVLCGVGGQGTVLAAKLIAQAAMLKGYQVMSAETIGMAQRGGSVFSFVRFGDKVLSPMIGRSEADVIIAFEPAEAARVLPMLKKGGTVITASHAVQPVTATLQGGGYDVQAVLEYLKKQVQTLLIIDTEAAFEKLGSSKVMNTLLLGTALKTAQIGLEREDVWQAILCHVPERFHEMNHKALFYEQEGEKFK